MRERPLTQPTLYTSRRQTRIDKGTNKYKPSHLTDLSSFYHMGRGTIERPQCAAVDVPSVLERLASFPTALPVSLQLSLLCVAFAMPLRCSPLKFFVPGASQTSVELRSLPWSSPVFSGVPQSSPEFPSLLWSSPVFAGVPPCPPEFLLLPQSPFPSEFFGDSS